METWDEALRAAWDHHEAGDHDGAARICSGVLSAEPGRADALHLLGLALARQGRAEDARLRLEEAVALVPTCPELLRDLGRLLRDLAQWEEAADAFRRTASVQGDSPSLCCDLAFVLTRSGDLDGAAAAWERAVKLEPENTSHHLQHFAARYRAGDFLRAWEEYEWRLQLASEDVAFGSPRWDGSPLDGGTVLIHAEQGLGDQIQFIRYAPMVAALGGCVIVHCSPTLVRLARTCPGVADAIRFGTDPLPEHSVHIWSGSLPRIFGTKEPSIPAEVPYLFADAEQVDRWRKALSHFRGVRVGINWEGNRANVQGQNRAIPLTAFHSLGRLEGVHLFSLQQGEPAEQLQDLPDDLRIVNLGQFLGSLWVAAAVMEQLDLVVTNDTSLAHLAGALRRPVWTVLPEDACWRWGVSGEESRWYPTMRLFRRGRGEEWSDVLARVRYDLEELCGRTDRDRHTLRRSA